MRPASFLVSVFVLACSSSSSRSPDAGATGGDDGGGGGGTIDGGGALSCGTTLTSYCTANSCPHSLDGAKQDPSLCPASLTPCGDNDVITKINLDTNTTYYYLRGALVAVGHRTFPRAATCLAGPSTFTPPTCSQPSQTLPACMR